MIAASIYHDRIIYNIGSAISESTYSNPDRVVSAFTANTDDFYLQGSVATLPFAFHFADYAFAGPAAGGVQLDAKYVGDGYADVVWHYDSAANLTHLWIDTDDNGIFSDPDLYIEMAGRVQLLFSTVTQALPYIRAGQLRPSSDRSSP